MSFFEKFRREGISFLDRYVESGSGSGSGSKESNLGKFLEEANRQYFNETPVLSDMEYDILKEYIERRFPQHPALAAVGAAVPSNAKNKATLPYEMASMNKIKPDTEALANWMRKYKGPYVVSCKLDGVSGLYIHEAASKKHRLFTRGDGRVGQDISSILPFLNLPKLPVGTAVRGEFLLSKQIFQERHSQSFANARNRVSGILLAKKADPHVLADIDFVAYEVISPALKPSEQMKFLSTHCLNTVYHEVLTALSNEVLSDRLLEKRSTYIYEMDGLVIAEDKIHPRNTGNPEHAFAFKMVIQDQQAEAKVVDVIWTPSKNGYLKPRVRIEPIRLRGVTIEYATGFNGKFIQENRIGVGAVISMIRSGDVIPFIQSVVVPAERARMPDVPFVWTESGVDILLKDVENDQTVREKVATAFFVHFKVDGLSAGNISRLFEAGYDSVPRILRMSKQNFLGVDGFQEKMASKIHDGIREKMSKATLLDWMVASNRLGRGLGEKKLQLIVKGFPDIALDERTSELTKVTQLMSLPGIGKENATEFVKNLPAFRAFWVECGSPPFFEGKTPKVKRAVGSEGEGVDVGVGVGVEGDESHPLYHKKIVMTKVRDKAILEKMAKVGATLEEHVRQDTFALIVKSKEDVSNKTKEANRMGIPIMTPDEFKQIYL